MVDYKYAYISQGKLKIGRNKYNLLRKTYNVLSYGGILSKYNYIFRVDKIKVVSLMQHIQENLQLRSGPLSNVTIDDHKFKNIPVYERCGKCI